MRITLNVADVSRLHPMLCHHPELVPDESIADGRASWLPRLPSFCFEQRVSGQGQTRRKRNLDWRVKKIFLKRVNNPMLHFFVRNVRFLLDHLGVEIGKRWQRLSKGNRSPVFRDLIASLRCSTEHFRTQMRENYSLSTNLRQFRG